MTKTFRASLTLLSGLTLVFLVVGLSQVGLPARTSTTTSTSRNLTACQVRGVLPDPNCTPGATDPAVTQENIQTTICVTGYTKTVRPSTSVTNPIKVERLQAYGLDGKLADYELDHLVPLTIGGAPSSLDNLWPEAYVGEDDAGQKDRLENKLNDLVCDGAIPLAIAQQAIATDWLRAFQLYIR